MVNISLTQQLFREAFRHSEETVDWITVAKAKKDKEIEKRMAAVEAACLIRERIAQAHGTFPEIDSLIRETREGLSSNYD